MLLCQVFLEPTFHFMQLKKWKNPHKFQRIMINYGFEPQEAHRVWIRMNKWQSVHRRAVRFVMNLKWFRKQGLVFLNDFAKRPLELPCSVADRGAAYLAGTSRSVGRGWSPKATSYPADPYRERPEPRYEYRSGPEEVRIIWIETDGSDWPCIGIRD